MAVDGIIRRMELRRMVEVWWRAIGVQLTLELVLCEFL